MADGPFHFIFGLADDPDAFAFVHYLSIRAAHKHHAQCRLLFHYHHEPNGTWWEHARPLVELHRVELPTTIFGRSLRTAAHRSDVLRLQLLIEHGGIYLDLDVIVLRPLAGLLSPSRSSAPFVIGQEGDDAHGGAHGLCNAVLLARPNASFARRWLREYHSFGRGDGDGWSSHSVQRPAELAAAHPDEVRLLPYDAFFWPDWDADNLRMLLLERSDPLRHLQQAALGHPAGLSGFAIHLYSSLSHWYVLEHWSPEYVTSVPATLNCVLQAAFAPFPLAPLPSMGIGSNCSCEDILLSAGSSSVAGSPAHRNRFRHTPPIVGHWPLRRAPVGSERLLLDLSGQCNHGWIYSGACASKNGITDAAGLTCWWAEEQGDPHLSLDGDLEAFVPLPVDALTGGEFVVSWWACVHSTERRRGQRVSFWSLSFVDGAVLSASAEPESSDEMAEEMAEGPRRILPMVTWKAGRRLLVGEGSVVLRAPHVNVGSNGWHHYSVVASAAEQRHLSLHLDGVEIASVAWSTRLQRLTSRRFGELRGLWVAGVPQTTIGGRRPTTTRSGRASHRVELAQLGIIAAALPPAELPSTFRIRRPGESRSVLAVKTDRVGPRHVAARNQRSSAVLSSTRDSPRHVAARNQRSSAALSSARDSSRHVAEPSAREELHFGAAFCLMSALTMTALVGLVGLVGLVFARGTRTRKKPTVLTRPSTDDCAQTPGSRQRPSGFAARARHFIF
jgi:hypothetical protein